jgi:hypothetical protein
MVAHVREERMVRDLEDRVLRRIYGPKRDKATSGDYITQSCMLCTPQQILFE